MTSYDTAYVDQCRDTIGRRVAAFEVLPESPEREAFEPMYYGDLVVLLDRQFVHRGHAGGAQHEVAVLVEAMLGDGTASEPTEITRLAKGAPVVVTRDAFLHLSDAFFDEIEARTPLA